MCGRLVITQPAEALAALFDAVPGNDLPGGARYNVCPTQAIAVCTSEGGRRRLRAMRWGFVPHWYRTPTDGPLLINARADTVAAKPAFRAAVRERRCLIPADGFYEWTRADPKKPLPWYIHRADGAPMALAGIWQDWEREGQRITGCAIVTTDAGPGMSAIHDREPVIVERADWPLWLGEAGHGAAALMHAAPEGVLVWHRVGVEVNSNRAEGPGLCAPLAA
ncbi:MAG: SOS response-associated peptidase [Rhodobacteraceae bacterium]|nr:SOS response-associated peptidase [Paracoccaceae bacterium]